MISLVLPSSGSLLSPEQAISPKSFVSAPSSPNWKLDWQVPKSPRPHSSAFHTEWKEFMVSSQEPTVEMTMGHHVAHSSSLTGSDFEFDLGSPDVQDPPVSPKLAYSVNSIPSMFTYSDFWTDKQVYKRQVPVLASVPRRSSPTLSVRQLVAADMSDDASSCASYPQSPRSRSPYEQSGRPSVGTSVGGGEEVKSPDVTSDSKSKSSQDGRIFNHSSRTRRVHHADEDIYPSSRFSDSPLSSWGDEDSSINLGSASQTRHRKRWTLKELLRSSRRSSFDQGKATKMESVGLRVSKSSPERVRPRSPKTSPRPMSPHEAHYKNQRAQWDEMKKKTTLPFRQGLFGCLGGVLSSGIPEYRQVM